MLIFILPLILETLCQSGCTPPQAGCVHCDSLLVCTSCITGYYLEGTCKPCTLGCKSCTALAICQECKPAFYLLINTCLKCNDTLCNVCNQTLCLECQSGYFMDNDQCTQCSDQLSYCLACNGTDCNQCQKGYDLEGGRCAYRDQGLSQTSIIIIATVVCSIVVFVFGACLSAYYMRKIRRPVVHDSQTRPGIQLQTRSDMSTQQASEINFRS